VDVETTREVAAVAEDFAAFVAEVEPRLRAAFVGMYGAETGRDAAAEALAYAWSEWPRVSAMDNPSGYLFRVGQSRVRPLLRRGPDLEPVLHADDAPWCEPALVVALNDLTAHQRAAVVLAHGYGCTHAEVAELLGISRSTVQNHVERAMARLRAALEVHDAD
jgi:DNA-directed RNA polymerase specialized sigma24 family protein